MDPMDEMLMIRPPAGAAESRWSADADKKKTDSTFVEKVRAHVSGGEARRAAWSSGRGVN